MYWYVIIFTNSICWNEALQAIEEASTGTVADVNKEEKDKCDGEKLCRSFLNV
jgi:hypothetical protein